MQINNNDKAILYQQKKHLLKKRKAQVVKLAICLLLVLGITVGATTAFLVTHSASLTNTFKKSVVSCEVKETFENNVKKDVSIKNTGDTQAYIRAYVNITWMDQANNKVYASKPVSSKDYQIVYTNNDWILGSDGYWYYKSAVDPNETTTDLIKSCELLTTAEIPEGYQLSVEIICSAIQSTPTKAVIEDWNVQLDSDNKIIGIGG